MPLAARVSISLVFCGSRVSISLVFFVARASRYLLFFLWLARLSSCKGSGAQGCCLFIGAQILFFFAGEASTATAAAAGDLGVGAGLEGGDGREGEELQEVLDREGEGGATAVSFLDGDDEGGEDERLLDDGDGEKTGKEEEDGPV